MSKMQGYVIIALLLAAVTWELLKTLVIHAWLETGPDASGWSYSVVAIEDFDLNNDLTELGEKGWDMVSCRRAMAGSGISVDELLKSKGWDINPPENPDYVTLAIKNSDARRGLYECIFKMPAHANAFDSIGLIP
ncbi:MAG: hypothetical protein Q8R92_20965 [Deltaproteobacteria bacterium]|nr:hypothetical protein [Deltaproteobacteria bacterium]